MTDLQRMMFFLTLAMIHPTCLHLCTKLLSKARKGDAIHPEKSALFTIYWLSERKKNGIFRLSKSGMMFCSVIWPDFTEIIPNFSAGLFLAFPDNVGLPKKSRVQSQSPTGRLRWGEGPWQVAVEGKLLNINQKRHPPPSRYDGEEGALIYSFRWSWPPRLRDSVVSF